MGYDRGDSFCFDFESNRIPFGSESKGKLSPRSYPIQSESKWKYSFLSVALLTVYDGAVAASWIFLYFFQFIFVSVRKQMYFTTGGK